MALHATALTLTMSALRALALSAAFITLSCASSDLPEGIREPEVQLAQVFAGEGMFQMRGRLSIPYVIEVTNTSAIPIELERVQLRTIGAGAYEMSETVNIEPQQIAPGATRQITFTAWGFSNGGSMNASIPTTVRAIAHFTSGNGRFRKVVTGSLGGAGGTV